MTLLVIQVVQRPANPLKDDRLDLSASGKCRSDPARLRAQGRQRGRGRHSLDIGRDLKRTMTNPTIDENVRPHIHSVSHACLWRLFPFICAMQIFCICLQTHTM